MKIFSQEYHIVVDVDNRCVKILPSGFDEQHFVSLEKISGQILARRLHASSHAALQAVMSKRDFWLKKCNENYHFQKSATSRSASVSERSTTRKTTLCVSFLFLSSLKILNFSDCDICNAFYTPFCREHPLYVICDRPVNFRILP